MMNSSEKRRAMANAIEQLSREGIDVISFSSLNIAIPVLTVEVPPTWLLPRAVPIRERVNGVIEEIAVARLSGCIIRWMTKTLPEAYQITQNLNPYAPEHIAQWPVNL